MYFLGLHIRSTNLSYRRDFKKIFQIRCCQNIIYSSAKAPPNPVLFTHDRLAVMKLINFPADHVLSCRLVSLCDLCISLSHRRDSYQYTWMEQSLPGRYNQYLGSAWYWHKTPICDKLKHQKGTWRQFMLLEQLECDGQKAEQC